MNRPLLVYVGAYAAMLGIWLTFTPAAITAGALKAMTWLGLITAGSLGMMLVVVGVGLIVSAILKRGRIVLFCLGAIILGYTYWELAIYLRAPQALSWAVFFAHFGAAIYSLIQVATGKWRLA